MVKARITQRQVEQAKKAAANEFGLVISDEQARRILEIDPTLLPELNDSGNLDTAPRDYFSMAIVELVILGPPTSARDGAQGAGVVRGTRRIALWLPRIVPAGRGLPGTGVRGDVVVSLLARIRLTYAPTANRGVSLRGS